MKWLTVVSAASLLSSTSAWSFTWRNADGEATIETGHGPHACITVNHAKGKLFELDGEGEKNINMLMFSTPKCAGEPVGRATEEFTKESSVAIRGFKVVALDAANTGSTTASATGTGTSASGNGTNTSPTASPSSGTNGTSSDEMTTTSAAATAATTADVTMTETQGATATEDSTSGAAATTGAGENAAVDLSAGGAVKVLAAVVLGFAGLA